MNTHLRRSRDAAHPFGPYTDQYSTIVMETHRVPKADVTVIVHGQSDGLVRVLHGLCNAAVRHAMQASVVVAEVPAGSARMTTNG